MKKHLKYVSSLIMKISKIIPVLLIGTSLSAQLYCCRYKEQLVAPSPPAPSALTFIGDGPKGVYQESAGVWAPVTVDATYNHFGLADSYLAEEVDGSIQSYVDATTAGTGSYFLGFNFQNSQDTHDDAAIMVRPAIAAGYQVFIGSTYLGLWGTCADGDSIEISIDRNGNQAFILRKPSGGSWATIYTAIGFSYGKLFPICEIYGDAKLKGARQTGLSQSIIHGDSGDDATRPVLLITGLESNGSGMALDGDAFSYEIGQRNKFKILHNYTLEFERLDIGYNNRIGHVGSEAWGARHGIVLQLANRQEEGTFLTTTDTVYCVNISNGGTIVDNWAYGGDNNYPNPGTGINPWDTAVKRINAASSLLIAQTGKQPRLIWYWTQGLNDQYTGVNTPAQWKTKTLATIDSARALWGMFPIVMTEFGGAYTGYNAVIQEITTLRPQVYSIKTLYNTRLDDLHWDYDGNKAVANDFANEVLKHFNF